MIRLVDLVALAALAIVSGLAFGWIAWGIAWFLGIACSYMVGARIIAGLIFIVFMVCLIKDICLFGWHRSVFS